MAIRFALWQIIVAAGGFAAPPLYKDLVAGLRTSPFVSPQLFALIPNYDLMLDRAIELGWSGEGYKGHAIVQHPHGDVSRRLVSGNRPLRETLDAHYRHNLTSRGITDEDAAHEVLRSAILDMNLTADDDWVVEDSWPRHNQDSAPSTLDYFAPNAYPGGFDAVSIPALELPLANKEGSSWVDKLWAEDDKEVARSALAATTHLLVIGWAAGDGHIADLVRESLSSGVRCHVVAGDLAEAERVAGVLRLPNCTLFERFDSKYLTSDEFELLAPIRSDKQT